MAEIISFGNRRQEADDREKALERRRKIEAVRRMLNCTRCSTKCLKCGAHIPPEGQPERPSSNLRIPYRFCEACSEEYLDYIERLKGQGDTDCYWHNDQWLEAWGKWIDYQSCMDQYIRSREFLQLIHELKPSTPEG
jgi:hypothetical protein